MAKQTKGFLSTGILFLILVLVSANFACASSASGGGISNNSGVSSYPSIGTDGSGSPVVAWQDDTFHRNNEIYIRRWNGSNWEEIGTGSTSGGGISNHPLSMEPSIGTDGSGNPVVVWRAYSFDYDHTSNDFEIYIRRWNGSSWEEIGTGSASGGGISNNFPWSFEPLVIIDGSGNPVVAWNQGVYGPSFYFTYAIYVKRWNGSSWEEIGTGSASGEGISDNSGIAYNPSIAKDVSGNPVIVWYNEDFLTDEIYIKKWNGSSWEEIGTGSASGGGIGDDENESIEYYPSVTMDGSGNPVVVWEDDISRTWQIYVRRWNGSSWEEIGTGSTSGGGISNNSGVSSHPSIGTDGSGSPVVAWQDDTSGNSEIYVKRWNGSSWEEIGTGSASGGGISNNSGVSSHPSIGTDGSGSPVVAWQDDTSGNSEIYVKRWNGNNWVELPITYYIKGYVKDSSETGISNVTVSISGDASAEDITDVDGYYEFTNLVSGNYTITPTKANYTFVPVSISTISLSSNLDNQDFTGTSNYYVNGYIKDASGLGISGVTVTLSGADSGTYTTTSSGYYEFTGLTSGNYIITPSKSGYIFTPANRSYEPLASSQSNQNFTKTTALTITDMLLTDGSILGESIDAPMMKADEFVVEIKIHITDSVPIKNVKVICYVDVPTAVVPVFMSSFDKDNDGRLDEMYPRKFYPIAKMSNLPRIWEGKRIYVKITEIDGAVLEPEVSYSKNFSIYYVAKNSTPFDIETDGYHFRNPDFNWLSFREWWWAIKSADYSPWFIVGVGAQWWGRCFGMSATSIMYFSDPTSKPIDKPTRSMEESDFMVMENITRYQVSQIFELILHGLPKWQTPEYAYSEIEQSIKIYNLPIILAVGSEKGNHAVVGYRIIRDLTENKASVSVYDCEYPWSVIHAIFDLANNEFLYWYFDKIETITTHEVMSLEELISTMAYCVKYQIKEWYESGLSFLGVTCPVKVLVIDEQGRRVGYVNGQNYVNEIPGSIMREIDAGGNEVYTFFYLPKNLRYRIELFGQDTGRMDLGIVIPKSEQTATQVAHKDVAITDRTKASLIMGANTNYVLRIDTDGDGRAETFKTADYWNEAAQVSFPASLENVVVYPNPFKPREAYDGLIKIINLTETSKVKIYTLTGELVREFTKEDLGLLPYGGYYGIAWDGKNQSGNAMGSGTYFYYITDDTGKKVFGKISIIR